MGIVAILTMIVISFALLVGVAIGMICGEIFGDFSADSTQESNVGVYGGNSGAKSNAVSWFGGALEAIFGAFAEPIAALPVALNAAKNNVDANHHPLEKLAMRLFEAPSGIDWAVVDATNPTVEFLESMYKLYAKKQQAALDKQDKNISTLGVKSTRSEFIIKTLDEAGFDPKPHDESGLLSTPVIYADIGAGDCKLTLAIAKHINAAKIYNIDVNNYCPMMFEINYIDGSIDKTIDIPDNSVNLITMINSLHHMADYEHKVDEAKRILAPGGMLLVYDHVISDDNNELKRIIYNQHFIHYVASLAAQDTLLDYDEFKTIVAKYMLNNTLYLFNREQLDQLFLGGKDGISSNLTEVAFSQLDVANLGSYDNVFAAVYKKND
ncbi:SAM-dependent methyltransferase [Faustovirus]|nr:SAM-dependent methyltransferase [Faustovirus]